MRILVTGPQGSGKSTQAVLLAQDLGVPYIQLGEILRNIALIDDSKKAEKVREKLQAGKLVDFDLVAEIINKRLQQVDCSRGFVLDGYPRSMTDIQNLNQKLDRVIFLRISEKVGVDRLLKRGRADDTRGLISERLRNYYTETQPILDYFEKSGILVEINGEASVSKIHKDIISKLALNDIH